MKRIAALICAFFVLFSSSVNAAYTGAEIYNAMERAFFWLDKNVSPLADTDSVAADYYVMALRRADRGFDYDKYIRITASKKPSTNRDAQRIIMSNAASGGVMDNDFVLENTYKADLKSASDIADAITALLSGEYEIKNTELDSLAVRLLSMQDIDGDFDNDVLVTSKSIIALSFMSGNCYIVKGEEIGEEYRYDVNSAILRGVDYLQKSKNDSFGFGSPKNTAYAIMALDCAGVDADNDPGFSDGEKSTLSALMNFATSDGRIGKIKEDTAISVCALVSHLRAMQGNTMFFALRAEDMPYNPNSYVEDINYSGQGLQTPTNNEIIVSLDDTDTPFRLETAPPIEEDARATGEKSNKILPILVIIFSVVIITATIVWFVAYMRNTRKDKWLPQKITDDEED